MNYLLLAVSEIRKVKNTFLTKFLIQRGGNDPPSKNFNMMFLLATLKRQVISFFWASPQRSFNKVLIKRSFGIIKTYIKTQLRS